MCGSKCCGGGCCSVCKVGKVLVVVGGLNWGLVGLGMLFGGADWNVVGLVLGSVMWLEALVYLLVGVATVMMLVGCKCKKCEGGACASGTCSPDEKSGDKMGGNM